MLARTVSKRAVPRKVNRRRVNLLKVHYLTAFNGLLDAYLRAEATPENFAAVNELRDAMGNSLVPATE